MAQGIEVVGTLLERDAELSALERALDGAMSGTGSLLMIEGAAGVGKSALLREFGARAASSDARVLTAVGGELERDFPYGLVRQLLEPVVRGADAERRAQLLSGAAALAAPIVGGQSAGDAETGDASYAVLHGLYWLLSALAEEEPLVLVLDDLHWADEPTLRFVDFLARRVSDLPLLVVLGLRPAEPGVDRTLLDSITASAGDAVLHPALLSADAVRAMVADRLGAEGDEVTATAHETTGGNPLLLRELMRSLRGGEVTAQAVRAAVPSSVTRSVRRRLDALPRGAQELAAALAVLQDGGDADLAAQLSGQDQRRAREHLRTLREAEILMEGDVRFLHPLVREAVAGSVSANDRDELHAAAARALRNRPEAAEQLMIHLLAAPPSGEQWAIDLLIAAGRRASAEGAPEAAVRRLRRALEEGGGGPQLLLELGVAEMRSSDPAAHGHLVAAAEGNDALVAAQASQAIMALEFLSGEIVMSNTVAGLYRALERLPAAERSSTPGEQLLGTLAVLLALDTTLAEDRKAFLADPANDGSPMVASGRSFQAAADSSTVEEITELIDQAWADRPMTRIAAIELQAATLPFGSLFQIDGRDEADRALREAEETGTAHGSRHARATSQQLRGVWHLTYGSAASSVEASREASELQAELGIHLGRNGSLATLAYALVQLGRLEEAETILRSTPTEPPEAPVWTDAMPRMARARLRLAQGRPAEAVADLEVVQSVADALSYRRFPVHFAGVELAQAYAAAGRTEEALATAREEIGVAEVTGRASLLVAGLTTLGVAEGGEAGLEHLRRAVEESSRSLSPFWRATAHVEAGSAVRRAGHRTEARDLLRIGADQAAKADARPLHARATEELVVAGGKPRAAYSSGVDSLTPSERRVADLAAQGLTNRQIAETLFVTQKTVEVHLGHTYGKLEIRSRTELGSALGFESSPSA